MRRKALVREATDTYQARSERLKDLPENLRPRELLERVGVENLNDADLLAVLLGTGTRGLNVLDLARQLLRHYGNLTALSRANLHDLRSAPELRGLGRVKAMLLKAALDLPRRVALENREQRPAVRTPEDAARLMRERALSLTRECFWVIPLDARNRLQADPVEISRGILDASLVHPREVFQKAILVGSKGIVLAHNHPSGDPTPSAEDIRITRQLVQAGRILDIHVLDHVIIGQRGENRSTDYLSLRETGLVDFAGGE